MGSCSFSTYSLGEGRGCSVLHGRRGHGYTEMLSGTAERRGCFELQAGKRSQGHMVLTGEERRGFTLLAFSSYSWAEGGKTDWYSWTEGGHLETCSSSMNPTLGLLWGRVGSGERREMTTGDPHCIHLHGYQHETLQPRSYQHDDATTQILFDILITYILCSTETFYMK